MRVLNFGYLLGWKKERKMANLWLEKNENTGFGLENALMQNFELEKLKLKFLDQKILKCKILN